MYLTSPMSVLAPSQAPLYLVEPASARITSASHLSRLRQDFLLARSCTRMTPCTVCMNTCRVLRWLWLPPMSHNSTKNSFSC